MNSAVVAVTHLVAGNVTPAVMQQFVVALPAIGLGALAGFALDGRVAPARFHRVVLVALVAIGLSLVL